MSKSLTHLCTMLVASLVLATVLFTVAPLRANAAPPAQGRGFNCTYVVRPGDNLYRLGIKYGVSPFALAQANNLPNINQVYVGMTLRVPCTDSPTPQPNPPPNNCGIHVVQRGEWLSLIAARYGVSWQALAAANRITNPSVIYPGMRLIIPCGGGGTPTRVLFVQQPFPNQGVCSPVTVSGYASVTPFEATLTGRVYNAAGQNIGTGPIQVRGELGKPGTFFTQLAFDPSRASGLGRVEVAELSAKDGSVVVSTSVPVRFNCK